MPEISPVADVSSATELYDTFAKLRNAGWSYRDIGLEYGLSHERVRQVLVSDGKDWSLPTAAEKRAVRVATLNAWLDAHGPVTRDVFMAEHGLTAGQLTTLTSAGLDTHLILLPNRSARLQFTDEMVIDALQSAWSEVRRLNPESSGLSYIMYERVRRASDPSAAILVTRYRWEAICAKAGVPSGLAWRLKDTYSSRWTDQDMLDIVATYVSECRDLHERPTYLGYERWQQEHESAPSGTLIRTRMRALGCSKWADIVSMALRGIGND